VSFGHALEHVWNALEQVDRRRALLDHAHGDFLDADAAAVRADDELAGEDVLVDEARAHRVEQRRAAERLEAVRVGAAETEKQPEHARVSDARGVAEHGAVVLGAREELRADDEIGLAAVEHVDRAAVEVRVAEVDLVANDDLPAREEDALLERLAVVRLAERDEADLVRIFRGELFGDFDGAIARAVLREDDLVHPPERLEPLAQVDDSRVQDRLLVVNRDDDRNSRLGMTPVNAAVDTL